MIVVVHTPEPDCPTHRALVMEDVEHEERVLRHALAYGCSFVELWAKREPFVSIEWDIIPWPGAVAEIAACPEPWCALPYPVHVAASAPGLGIGKYRPDDMTLPIERWDQLDGVLWPAFVERFGGPHVHLPAVAHARREPSR